MEDQTKQSPASEADTDERSPTPPADDTGRDLLAENAALREQIRLSEARERMTAELAAAGARSPGLLFDSAKTRLQFADDGRIANAAALVELLKTEYPEQFGTRSPSIDGGAGRSTPPPLTKAALAKMTPAEIAKLDWAVVRRVLSEK